MLKDILGQAWEAMLYNRRRTAITMIGMAWGIATVVLLLAYGAGFSRAIEAIFAQWGTNIIGVFPGRTSEQAGGEKSGVKVRFTGDDVDRLIACGAGYQSHFTGGVQRRDGAERSAYLYVDSERREAGVSGHLEAGYRCGQILQRAGRSAASTCVRDRVGGQDQALLRRVGGGPDDPAERRAVYGDWRAEPRRCRKAANRTIATGRSMCPSAP